MARWLFEITSEHFLPVTTVVDDRRADEAEAAAASEGNQNVPPIVTDYSSNGTHHKREPSPEMNGFRHSTLTLLK